jgi:hypothetical protein
MHLFLQLRDESIDLRIALPKRLNPLLRIARNTCRVEPCRDDCVDLRRRSRRPRLEYVPISAAAFTLSSHSVPPQAQSRATDRRV